jgi:lactate dehydrogenase-like 2-hydroxyacid dehydrogenase
VVPPPVAQEVPIPPSILITKPMTASAVAALQETFDVHTLVGASDPEAVLRKAADTVRGIAGGKVTGAMMKALPKLEIIANSGVGVDTNDMPTARALGISVTNTPDVLNQSVAELTVGLMLAQARGLPRADAYVRDGGWADGPFTLGTELRGKAVGLAGLGRIGKEIARRLAAFDMDVRYFGRNVQPDQPYTYHADLVKMARAVDWLVVIAPINASTKGLITREVLEALGPSGRIVNVSRGALVDEPALVDLLQTGGLGGAALDVFANEPDVGDAILGLPNVVVSPHMGSRTHEAREAMDRLVVENLRAHFDGRPPPNLVT